MAYLVYTENEPRQAPIPLGRLNANRQFRKHLENWFFLKLVLRNGNRVEKHQASKELAICDRKLEYWKRKPSFDTKQSEKDIADLRSKWLS